MSIEYSGATKARMDIAKGKSRSSYAWAKGPMKITRADGSVEYTYPNSKNIKKTIAKGQSKKRKKNF
jgi:hypothetical protein